VSQGNTKWAAIRAGLGEYRPKELIVRLAELFKGRVPIRGRENHMKILSEIHQLLMTHAGRWYRECPLAAPDYPYYGLQQAGVGVWENVRAVVAYVTRSHAWLRALDSVFTALELPGDEPGRVAALAGAVRQVVALTGEWIGWDDDWYSEVDAPILWLLESQGIAPTAELRQRIANALSAFDSWMAPPPEQAQAVADEIALASVREELRQRYG
jgi:hypothetical protein